MNGYQGDPGVVVRGEVPEPMIAYAREKLVAALAHTSAPVLTAEVRVEHSGDPAHPRPNHVEMTVDLNGTPVRAQQSAPTMTEAIDGTAKRLRRRLGATVDRPRARRQRHADHSSWHHDDEPSVRRHVSSRPVADRTVRRDKTFALDPCSLEDALFALDALDHDFYLFVHDETGAEAVVYRSGSGYGLMQRVATADAIARVEIPLESGAHPVTTTLPGALSVLDESDAAFEFFVDAESGRAMVAYRRYDGNYGVVSPR